MKDENYDWAKCEFTTAELQGKSVEFRVPLEQGGYATGIGQLDAIQNEKGLLRVTLTKFEMSAQGPRGHKVFIPAYALPALKKSVAGSKAEFTLVVERPGEHQFTCSFGNGATVTIYVNLSQFQRRKNVQDVIHAEWSGSVRPELVSQYVAFMHSVVSFVAKETKSKILYAYPPPLGGQPLYFIYHPNGSYEAAEPPPRR
jgi:hypothetical protein